MLEFYKYQGAGNDFIIIDNRSMHFPKADCAYVRQLCDRRFGIGADGLMLVELSDNYDFTMVYYNADGYEGSMCGNGGRCIVAFAKFLGIIGDQTVFDAVDGVHRANIMGAQVSLEMIDVHAVEEIGADLYMNTGSPHYVLKEDDIEHFDIVKKAHQIRYNDRFKAEGTNVNFIAKQGANFVLRTYERGVEDETLACGTGATATALALNYWDKVPSPICLKVRGGELLISFDYDGMKYSNIWLEGPAEQVFKGSYDK